MSISFLVAAAGTLAALAGLALLIRRCAQAPRADLIAWALALAGMAAGLAAQAVGYHRGFGPATFRAAQLGLALIAPLALAWGMAETAARGTVARFAARLCLSGLFVVAGVILATDVLSDQPFTHAWPLARAHYQVLPLGLLALVAVLILVTILVSLAVAGLRTRREPGWRPVLLVLGAAAVAALATQGLLASLPVNSAYAALSLAAAAATWLAGDRAARIRLAGLRAGPASGGGGQAWPQPGGYRADGPVDRYGDHYPGYAASGGYPAHPDDQFAGSGGYPAHGSAGPGYGSAGSGGYPAHGSAGPGYGSAGFDSAGFDSAGFDSAGFDSAGFDSAGFGSAGFGSAGFGSAGFDSAGFGSAGFGSAGFGSAGFAAAASDSQEFPVHRGARGPGGPGGPPGLAAQDDSRGFVAQGIDPNAEPVTGAFDALYRDTGSTGRPAAGAAGGSLPGEPETGMQLATLSEAALGAAALADPTLDTGRLYGQIAIYTLLESGAAEFDRLASTVLEQVRTTEPDTLVFVVHGVPSAPLQRILYQVYRDRAAYDEHQRQRYVTDFDARLRPLVLATNVIELGVREAKVSALAARPGPAPGPAPAAPPGPVPRAGRVP